ncbi:hypothetical protein AD941_06910 [Gluconobacter albidus]|uniref:Uncharacterized protein n=1 Tax=Gluconobacter albidus TaxID=318683 RepID=A0AAW3QX08_9PROT|nr:hypothetical protein AD941_06910 [Gluconobacter albidus]
MCPDLSGGAGYQERSRWFSNPGRYYGISLLLSGGDLVQSSSQVWFKPGMHGNVYQGASLFLAQGDKHAATPDRDPVRIHGQDIAWALYCVKEKQIGHLKRWSGAFQECIFHFIAPDFAALGRMLSLEAFGGVTVDQADVFSAAEDLLKKGEDLICLSRCLAQALTNSQNVLSADSAGRVHAPVFTHPIKVSSIQVSRSGGEGPIFLRSQIIDDQCSNGARIQSGCLQWREIFEGGKRCLPVMTQKLPSLSVIEIFNDAAVGALLADDVQPCSA